MGIKANAAQLVNSLAGLALLLSPLHAANAADELDSVPQPPKVPSPADPLPNIEARDFAVKIAKRSKSANTYLMDDLTEAKTTPGKILLLRRNSQPMMAFRVVKLYPEKKQFAAKRVRRYGEIHALDPGEPYDALEKVGDVVIPPPTAQDKADLKELEAPAVAPITPPELPKEPPAEITGQTKAEPAIPPSPEPEVKPFDSDLDSATTPPPSGGVDSANSAGSPRRRNPDDTDDDEAGDAHLGMTVDEVNSLDPNLQWLTASFGFFRNYGADGQSAYFTGGGLRYAVTLGKSLFLRRAHAQDSLALEAGAFYYKILNFQGNNDSYAVVPLIGTLRYNILFGENFGIFFYGGIMQNNVTSVVGGNEDAKAVLSSVFPAAGAGILFRVGPSWDARVDLGIESIGLGLVLRF